MLNTSTRTMTLKSIVNFVFFLLTQNWNLLLGESLIKIKIRHSYVAFQTIQEADGQVYWNKFRFIKVISLIRFGLNPTNNSNI